MIKPVQSSSAHNNVVPYGIGCSTKGRRLRKCYINWVNEVLWIFVECVCIHLVTHTDKLNISLPDEGSPQKVHRLFGSQKLPITISPPFHSNSCISPAYKKGQQTFLYLLYTLLCEPKMYTFFYETRRETVNN